MDETVLTNAKIVLADQVINGSVRAVDGKIADISEMDRAAIGVDLDGDYLIPV